jgi:transcriptional regulator with XRE-family HTH domain
MRDLGAQVLRVREFLGLSQEQLARLAGVSQGAISRLENGRGLATPLLVVMKTCSALRAALGHVDQAILSAEARQLVEGGTRVPGEDTIYPSFAPTHDPGVEELLRLYHGLSQHQREQLLAVLRAMATALTGDREDKAPSGRSR